MLWHIEQKKNRHAKQNWTIEEYAIRVKAYFKQRITAENANENYQKLYDLFMR